MARNFLGKGWRYPVMIDRHGGMAQSSLDDLVRESILIILGTAPGEMCIRDRHGSDESFRPVTVDDAGNLYVMQSSETGLTVVRYVF